MELGEIGKYKYTYMLSTREKRGEIFLVNYDLFRKHAGEWALICQSLMQTHKLIEFISSI